MSGFLKGQSEYRVYAENTDFMGIVYYADYLLFFERARTELLRSLGLTLTETKNDGKNFAINHVQVRYHHPACLDDLLLINTTCKKVRPTMLEFQQVMHKDSSKPVAEATIQVVCVNDKLKPCRLPDLILKKMTEQQLS